MAAPNSACSGFAKGSIPARSMRATPSLNNHFCRGARGLLAQAAGYRTPRSNEPSRESTEQTPGVFLNSIRRGRGSMGSIAEMLVMLAKQKLIGHSGDVVAHNDVPGFRSRKLFVESGHRAPCAQVVTEKSFEINHRAISVFADGGVIVNMGE